MDKRASLVVTTIFDPVVIEEYYANFKKFGRLDQVRVYVIPDRKTPPIVYKRCNQLKESGLDIVCPSLEEQESFLRRIGFYPHLIPYDSDNRRNVGYLMALNSGSEFIISIDDDNYCRMDEDVFLEHLIVCERKNRAIKLTASSGWFNICSLLHFDCPILPYPRGFPYFARENGANQIAREETLDIDIHINAGLWLRDPDLDGITWLVSPAHSIEFIGESIVLGEKTWSPINTQNTALRREAITAYYFFKMGYPLSGMEIDRYGDIFSGYFVQACMRQLGGYVRVGTPIAEHRRNSHNYLRDAFKEMTCILVLEDLLPWLREVKLEGTSYPEVYISLSYALEDEIEKIKGSIWSEATRGYFHQMAYYMRQWAKVSQSLL